MTFNKIQVVCPANVVTGGPESLHNLVSVINSLGFSASIVYYPYSKKADIPSAYHNYAVKAEQLEDQSGNLIIFPEIFCMEALRIEKATAAIWWLSVDNFLERKYHNARDIYRYLKKVLRGSRPVWGVRQLKHLQHFSKAYYDEEFLKAHHIDCRRISGPISQFYLDGSLSHHLKDRKNQILYNPTKGKALVEKMIQAFPEFDFVPLKGLQEEGLRSAFLSSKLYIDFGHHPGKERMPREAAVSGCCVITGYLGSAGNDFDIPIPKQFKLDQFSGHFYSDFESAVKNIFLDFDNVTKLFEPYRKLIRDEVEIQREDLLLILNH
jgi:hypothetical protein